MRVRLRGTRPGSDDTTATPARTDGGPKVEPRRTWNLWELDRLARALNGDPRAVERRLLLLHLRDFADAAGHLPAEFDPLVRDAFGAALAELA
jgi:hypothetical protein